MNKILILGATSLIAQHVSRRLCDKNITMHLVGRNENQLQAIADDLTVRGAKISFNIADFSDLRAHEELVNDSIKRMGGITLALLAYGSLPDQKECEVDVDLATSEIITNYLSVQSLISLLAGKFEEQGSGCIAVISSVAGDRGRKSNYIYGSAKAGLTVYLQGLRNRLASKNVHVLTIKPGFVDTPMTQNFEKGLLWVGPDKVAKDIVSAIKRKKDVLYTPWYWKWIMVVIKLIPERIFKKMNL